MKIYYSIRHYSTIFLQKPCIQNCIPILHNLIFKTNSTQYSCTTSGELHVSKSLNNFKVHYKDQFTCLLSKCIFCKVMSLHINKTTGKYFNIVTIQLVYILHFYNSMFKCFRFFYMYTLFKVW